MRRDAATERWLAWLCTVALAFGGAAVSLADAPRAHSDRTRAQPEQVLPKPVRSSAKAANPKTKAKTPKKAKTTRAKAASSVTKPRAAKVIESQPLDVATGPDDACHVQLRKLGVSFVKVSKERAPDVQLPIRLTGAIAGVEIKGAGKSKATHYLDCHLGLALLRWAPQLKAAGVKGIDHYSIYRPDAQVAGTRKPSGHSLAMAIDAARFHLSDGRLITVLDNWTDKTKGADPCAPRPQQDAEERLLRELVCDASQRGIFQTVVTPHHNLEHDNHVHLEVSRTFAPTWIH